MNSLKLALNKIKNNYIGRSSEAKQNINIADLILNTDIIDQIHDDLLATGGTARAAANLVEKMGGKVIMISFIIELSFLGGREKLKKYEKLYNLKLKKRTHKIINNCARYSVLVPLPIKNQTQNPSNY